MLLPLGMAQWKRMIGFILLPEFLFFSSIFHQSLKTSVFIGILRGGRDVFLFHLSSTFLVVQDAKDANKQDYEITLDTKLIRHYVIT